MLIQKEKKRKEEKCANAYISRQNHLNEQTRKLRVSSGFGNRSIF